MTKLARRFTSIPDQRVQKTGGRPPAAARKRVVTKPTGKARIPPGRAGRHLGAARGGPATVGGAVRALPAERPGKGRGITRGMVDSLVRATDLRTDGGTPGQVRRSGSPGCPGGDESHAR